MALISQVEVRRLDSIKSGMVEFYTPQSSHETLLAQIPAGLIDDLFVHHFQTDQLLVVRGSFVLVVLQNRRYEYIPLSEDQPQVVTIPPGIPHGAINLSQDTCMLVNAVLRHGPAHDRDYRPLRKPFPYDIARAKALLAAHAPLSACS
ncbi:MAG: dTDP-4-dehydrorhamnose 3,5-epimerase [Synechococcales cyanobacterium C42_A2020_086]|jgi:dTDP-4-dehydrorhamnose 3,5-epimerase-like enzyme|nr:dTDP-4-dehydrorhamnose 3,5-epimerase [Synechococcales cyanobacterium C42_A2020_086]